MCKKGFRLNLLVLLIAITCTLFMQYKFIYYMMFRFTYSSGTYDDCVYVRDVSGATLSRDTLAHCVSIYPNLEKHKFHYCFVRNFYTYYNIHKNSTCYFTIQYVRQCILSFILFTFQFFLFRDSEVARESKETKENDAANPGPNDDQQHSDTVVPQQL